MSNQNDDISDDFVVDDTNENKENEKQENNPPNHEGNSLKLNLLSKLSMDNENKDANKKDTKKNAENTTENHEKEKSETKLDLVGIIKDKLDGDNDNEIISGRDELQIDKQNENENNTKTEDSKIESSEDKEISGLEIKDSEDSHISTTFTNESNNEHNSTHEKAAQQEKSDAEQVENSEKDEKDDFESSSDEKETEKTASSSSDNENKGKESHEPENKEQESDKNESEMKEKDSSSSSNDDEENKEEEQKQEESSVLITTQLKDSVQKAREFVNDENGEPEDEEINAYSKTLAGELLKSLELPTFVKCDKESKKKSSSSSSSSDNEDNKEEAHDEQEKQRDFKVEDNQKPETKQDESQEEPIIHTKDFIIGKLGGNIGENQDQNNSHERQEKKSSSSSSDDEHDKNNDEKEKTEENKLNSENKKEKDLDLESDNNKTKNLTLSSTMEYSNANENEENDDTDVMVTRVKSRSKIPRIQESAPLYSDQELQDAFKKLKDKKILPAIEMRPSLIDYGRKMSVQHTMLEEYDEAASDDEAVNLLLDSLRDDNKNTNTEIEKQNIKERLEEVDRQKKAVEERYKDKINRMKEADKASLEKLKQNQEARRKEFEEKWSKPEAVIPYSKPSSRLLQLKRMQKAMAINHEFAKAKAFKQQAEEMQKEEAIVGSKQAVEVMKIEYKQLLDAQEKQLQCFLENCERKIRVQENLRDAELASLENTRKQLQLRPTNRIKKPRVTIPDVTSRELRATTPSGMVSTRTRNQYTSFKKAPEMSKLDVKPLDVATIIRPLTANSPRKSSRTMI